MESAFGVEHGEIAKFRFDPASMKQAQKDAAKKGKKTFRFDPASMKAGQVSKAFKLPGKGVKKLGAALKRVEPGSSNPKSVLASEKFSDPFGGQGKQPGHHLTERW